MENCVRCKNKPTDTGYAKTNKGAIMQYEHRIVYAKNNIGEDISNKIIHHTCGNRWCVNPKHLVAITRKQHAAEHGLSGWAKIHAEKIHCKNGHPFDKKTKHQRLCSICSKKYKQEWYLKNKLKNTHD